MGNRPKTGAKAKAKPVVQTSDQRVVIAYIHPGETSGYFTQALVNTLMFDQATERHVVGCLNEWSSANVSSARNSLTGRFLDEYDAEWLLWIDADMAFEHDALPRLLASADAAERPIVGGLCFGAHFGRLFPTIYQFARDEQEKIRTVRVEDYPIDALVPCAASGAAFLLIHRKVLEAMRDRAFNAAFPWFQETELGGQPAGEDITFCLRAGICGFPIYVNTAVQIGHHKSTVLDHATFQAQRAAASEAEGEPDAAADVG
jgi:hypothetical protein